MTASVEDCSLLSGDVSINVSLDSIMLCESMSSCLDFCLSFCHGFWIGSPGHLHYYGQIFLEAGLFFHGVRPAINVGISIFRAGYFARELIWKLL